MTKSLAAALAVGIGLLMLMSASASARTQESDPTAQFTTCTSSHGTAEVRTRQGVDNPAPITPDVTGLIGTLATASGCFNAPGANVLAAALGPTNVTAPPTSDYVVLVTLNELTPPRINAAAAGMPFFSYFQGARFDACRWRVRVTITLVDTHKRAVLAEGTTQQGAACTNQFALPNGQRLALLGLTGSAPGDAFMNAVRSAWNDAIAHVPTAVASR